MEEFDLNDLWRRTDEGAEAWYERRRPELVATARKKNDSVLQRIRRMVLSELVFSAAVFVAMLWYWELIHPVFFFLLEASILLVMYLSFRYYRQFSEDIEAVPTLSIVASTEGYLRILSAYRKRLLRLSVILMPFGLIVGFMAGFGIGTENDYSALATSRFWLVSAAALVLIAVPAYYFTTWYYRFYIGSKEKELAAVLERLREEE